MLDLFEYRQAVADQPIYSWQRRGMAWFYAPGYLAVIPEVQRSQLETELNQARPHTRYAEALQAHAVAARQTHRALFSTPFHPVCLTIYLNNRCNLSCAYCYAMPEPAQAADKPGEVVSLQAIRQATKLVAENCQAQQVPFSLVLHGGGEPTLDWKLADQMLNIVERGAEEHGLPIFRYIATNGVMPSDVAQWLMARFDLIGLSCDGPPQIQNAQRPLKSDGGSAPFVERMAQVAREAGKPLQVRVTLTRSSMFCQEEIADYLCQRLHPQEIRVEPVYQGGRAGAQNCLEIEALETYLAQFKRARRVAAEHGVSWTSASTRLGGVYGPYCHIFRGVLNLVPGDYATACFRTSHFDQNYNQDTLIGWQEQQTGTFRLDEGRIQVLRQKLTALPERCTDCFNRYHCTLGCPDRCPAEGAAEDFSTAADFRCHLQKGLALELMDELVPNLESDRVHTVSMEIHRQGWQ